MEEYCSFLFTCDIDKSIFILSASRCFLQRWRFALDTSRIAEVVFLQSWAFVHCRVGIKITYAKLEFCEHFN